MQLYEVFNGGISGKQGVNITVIFTIFHYTRLVLQFIVRWKRFRRYKLFCFTKKKRGKLPLSTQTTLLHNKSRCIYYVSRQLSFTLASQCYIVVDMCMCGFPSSLCTNNVVDNASAFSVYVP